jgi:hypothetical protein
MLLEQREPVVIVWAENFHDFTLGCVDEMAGGHDAVDIEDKTIRV